MSKQLLQSEADALFRLRKYARSHVSYELKDSGFRENIELFSEDEREEFFLDVHRRQINLKAINLQNRARQIIILARLDINGPPHRNPDGEEIAGTHIHYYREGYDDKWATQVPRDIFTDTSDFALTLDQFMSHCSIIRKPTFTKTLFT